MSITVALVCFPCWEYLLPLNILLSGSFCCIYRVTKIDIRSRGQRCRDLGCIKKKSRWKFWSNLLVENYQIWHNDSLKCQNNLYASLRVFESSEIGSASLEQDELLPKYQTCDRVYTTLTSMKLAHALQTVLFLMFYTKQSNLQQ